MSESQATYLLVLLTIQTALGLLVLGSLVFVAFQILKTVRNASDAVNQKVSDLHNQASDVIHQAQGVVENINRTVAGVQRTAASVTGAVAGAKLIRAVRGAAHAGTGVASVVTSGLLAGFERFLTKGRNGKEHK